MELTLAVRSQIYEHFHASEVRESHFMAPGRRDEFSAYDVSMLLLQDTGEAVWTHMRRGFPSDSMQAYIDLWGVMQAVQIHQDAIAELWLSLQGEKLPRQDGPWSTLRDLRNKCVGHPARRSHGISGLQRVFFGRRFGGYDGIMFELYDSQDPRVTFPQVRLGNLIREYDAQAASILGDLLIFMKQKWPPK